VKGLLADLDDTLYDYLPAHRAGLARVLPWIARALGASEAEAERAWDAARAKVKDRLQSTGSSHSRLLYLAEIAPLAEVRAWERAYWSAYLDAAKLRPGAIELCQGFRARGGKVALVTDQVLEIQLWKCERLGLFPHVDAIAASEEVPRDKPAPEIFRLAMARLGLVASECVMIGDHPSKDGVGARDLGIAYHHVVSSEHPERGGRSLLEVARELGVS
jgi:putative hydrolase of the HAD superfamily